MFKEGIAVFSNQPRRRYFFSDPVNVYRTDAFQVSQADRLLEYIRKHLASRNEVHGGFLQYERHSCLYPDAAGFLNYRRHIENESPAIQHGWDVVRQRESGRIEVGAGVHLKGSAVDTVTAIVTNCCNQVPSLSPGCLISGFVSGRRHGNRKEDIKCTPGYRGHSVFAG